MARLLAIDYGRKRTGIAVTDSLQIIATALEMVRTHDFFVFLEEYLKKEEVETFIVGKPSNLDGTPTHSTPLVEAFVNRLRKLYPNIPIVLEDERFTSKIALQTMIAMGTTKQERQEKEGNLDKISATIILQSYMERMSYRLG